MFILLDYVGKIVVVQKSELLQGQFNFACVIVEPLDHNTNQVCVKAKEELIELIGHTESKIVSDQNAAILARQLALHADVNKQFVRSSCLES